MKIGGDDQKANICNASESLAKSMASGDTCSCCGRQITIEDQVLMMAFQVIESWERMPIEGVELFHCLEDIADGFWFRHGLDEQEEA